MDLFFKELKLKNDYNLNFIYNSNKNEIVIKSFYYYFKIDKKGTSYQLFYMWKLGILGKHIFKIQFDNMMKVKNFIQEYSDKEKILISEINLNA